MFWGKTYIFIQYSPHWFAKSRAPKRKIAGDPRTSDPRTSDPGTGDPRTGDPRTSDTRTGDPRTGDPRKGEPRIGDPRTVDARKGDSIACLGSLVLGHLGDHEESVTLMVAMLTWALGDHWGMTGKSLITLRVEKPTWPLGWVTCSGSPVLGHLS